ncbi:energy-coupled thiamine transporter ThiT [Vagococcus salmoninarum]|uniref:Energy-coupled thiamine transporter ThiT n=1 Tax=Vagococcus salmoninarum TaxID=2739 RepID=A0A429ZCL9_9ENTE|nr:energy-coupled thiamine transporter ThiT [Vagococcus salmoninarum]MBE9389641.1 energy-coupled thiamine transporter ThiT [Vagococcus salmoninarum]RST91430.1 energy-coupled thiamine transporter ThiT [Vagococcus salmoninarum]
MTSKKLQVWIEGAIVAALAIALSMIPTNIGTSFSISLGMIPLTVYAIRRGLQPGLYAGLIWGLLHFLVGSVYFLSIVQVLIEYLLAFTFAGFAGLYKNKIQEALASGDTKKFKIHLVQATLLGTLMRYFWHFVAGVVFWGAYALWGMNPLIFSLVMNGASGLATALVSSVVIVLIGSKFPQVFLPKEKLYLLKAEK